MKKLFLTALFLTLIKSIAASPSWVFVKQKTNCDYAVATAGPIDFERASVATCIICVTLINSSKSVSGDVLHSGCDEMRTWYGEYHTRSNVGNSLGKKGFAQDSNVPESIVEKADEVLDRMMEEYKISHPDWNNIPSIVNSTKRSLVKRRRFDGRYGCSGDGVVCYRREHDPTYREQWGLSVQYLGKWTEALGVYSTCDKSGFIQPYDIYNCKNTYGSDTSISYCTTTASYGRKRKDGSAGACCMTDNDCKASCDWEGYCTQPAEKGCIAGYYGTGTRMGSYDACCRDGNDCCGSCLSSGRCSVHAAGDCGRCDPSYYGLGSNKGPEGVCCRDVNDCWNGCYGGLCTGKWCSKHQWGSGKGRGGGDDCCRDSEDCDEGCDDGICEPLFSCNRRLGQEDGVLGDCCEKGEDCVINCETSTGKCRNSNLACQSSAMTRKDGACCRLNSDCNSGKCPTGTCVGNGSPTTIGPIPTGDGNCIPGWCGKGLGKGPTGACCSVEGDCDDTCNGNGKCGTSDGTWKQPLGCAAVTTNVPTATKTTGVPTTTSGGKTCKGGYYKKGLKNGPDTYCCETNADCIGNCVLIPGDSYMCTGGSVTTTTTSVPTPTCTPGMEDIGDGDSEQGYCCTDSLDCQGECVGGICGPPSIRPAPSHKSAECIMGGFGYGNGNMIAGYCCSNGADCMYGTCVDAICGAGSAPTCPRPTKTTKTSSSPTPTSKPPKRDIKFGEIIVPPCIPPCTIIVVDIGGWMISVGGSFIPIIADDDDDDTTTTTTTTSSKTTTTTSSKTTTTTSRTSSTSSVITDPTPSPTATTVGPTSATTLTSGTILTTTTDKTTVIVPTNGTTIIVSTSNIVTTNGTSIVSPTATITTSTNRTTTATPTNATTVETLTSTNSVTIPGTNSRSVTTATTISPITTTTTNSIVVPVTTTTSTSNKPVTTTTSMTTTTSIPTGKTCKSGYFKRNQKDAPDGSCCNSSGDCIGECVFVPGDSYMCKSSGVTTITTGITTVPTTSSIPKPTPTCITGHCGLGLGKGPTGACCADHWDCNQVCNGDGKCSNDDDGTWTKKLPCP